MSDHPGNLILATLRDLRGDMADLKADVQELKLRQSATETQIVALRQSVDRR
ncbi:hypothetical protein [Rhodopila sp.]|jgi:hypothetical protein|uniref:hypothetical protein n=1 Tax=Rhodopila sp. TaxID=2480087 RepID=UPI002B76076C|nr:hypothetical protein [Rhodopila sp.]HVZ07204.1 hypothetical protein [Rhodopila sp.]